MHIHTCVHTSSSKAKMAIKQDQEIGHHIHDGRFPILAVPVEDPSYYDMGLCSQWRLPVLVWEPVG